MTGLTTSDNFEEQKQTMFKLMYFQLSLFKYAYLLFFLLIFSWLKPNTFFNTLKTDLVLQDPVFLFPHGIHVLKHFFMFLSSISHLLIVNWD